MDGVCADNAPRLRELYVFSASLSIFYDCRANHSKVGAELTS